VSEGVDIPRIVGGIYATNRLTDLAFRQIVLRAGRVLGPDDRTVAVWGIPPIPSLVDLANRMESEANAGLSDGDNEPAVTGEGAARAPSLFVPLGSGDAVRTGAIFRGEHLGDEELAEAEALIASSGSSAQPTEVILLLRDMKARGMVADQAPLLRPDPAPAVADDAPDVAEQVPLRVKHVAMRREIKAKVGQMRHRTGAEYSEIHRWLNRECGEHRIEAATTETLERRLVLLTEPAAWPWEDRWQGPPRDMW
jgi:hypothetical protein